MINLWHKKLILAIGWLMVISYFMCEKYLSLIRSELNKDGWLESHLGYLDLSFAVSSAIGSVSLCFIVKKLKSHYILIGGLIVKASVTLFMAFGNSFERIITLTALSGISSCLVLPTGNFFVQELVDEKNLSIGLSLFWTSDSVGAILASLIIINAPNWKTTYYISSGIAFACSFVGILTAIRRPSEKVDQEKPIKSETKEEKPSEHKIEIVLVMLGTLLTTYFVDLSTFWLPYFTHKYFSVGLVCCLVSVSRCCWYRCKRVYFRCRCNNFLCDGSYFLFWTCVINLYNPFLK